MTEPPSRFRIIPMPVIIALLAVGLVSSLAFRAIIVAEHGEPGWVRPLWYLGVLLNAVFFSYRYWVLLRRVRAVVGGDLDRKMRSAEPLGKPTANKSPRFSLQSGSRRSGSIIS